MTVPSLRVFCLASTQTLEEDPEGLFQVGVQKRLGSCRRSVDVSYHVHTVVQCCYIVFGWWPRIPTMEDEKMCP